MSVVTGATAPTDEARKLYADHLAEINKREVSSSENFDKSVLTFSSAGLALSVGFLKDFVPIAGAHVPWALYLSWVLFTLATCATIASFLVSSKALNAQKARAHDYYIAGDDQAYARTNRWDTGTTALNYFSAGAFLLAMVLSVLFLSLNLEKGSTMKHTPIQTTAGTVDLTKGLPVPTMQQVQRPPAPSTPAQTPPAPAPASTGVGVDRKLSHL